MAQFQTAPSIYALFLFEAYEACFAFRLSHKLRFCKTLSNYFIMCASMYNSSVSLRLVTKK